MNKEELLQLREQIVGKTRQLAIDSENTDPINRLEVLMGLIRSGDTSKEVMQHAYDAASQLPEDAKLDAFLDLIYEIDVQLGGEEPTGNSSQDEVDVEDATPAN